MVSKLTRSIPQGLRTPLLIIAAVLLAGALLWLNDRFLFESIWIVSSSMRPTLLKNERVYLQKAGVGEIRRFDVVVVNSGPLGHWIVKRVVGLPGERVRLEDSYRVFIDGTALNYKAMDGQPNCLIEANAHAILLERNPKFYYETEYGKDDLLLGPGEYYALGDNRLASGDSRAIGPVKGRLTLVWYSFDLKTGRIRWERLVQKVR